MSHCKLGAWTDAILDALNAEYAEQLIARTLQTQDEVDAAKAENPELPHLRIGDTVWERVPRTFKAREE